MRLIPASPLLAVALATAAFGLFGLTPVPAGQPAECHASYDPCAPIASDVDCLGGDGDGPEYTGQVRVIGPEEYGLDRDGNGIGCENS